MSCRDTRKRPFEKDPGNGNGFSYSVSWQEFGRDRAHLGIAIHGVVMRIRLVPARDAVALNVAHHSVAGGDHRRC